MFRSFFPVPKQFFSSLLGLLILAIIGWSALGPTLQPYLSLDRFLLPPPCAPTEPATPPGVGDTAQAVPGAELSEPDLPDSSITESDAPSATEARCLPEGSFLTAERVWFYQYLLILAVGFCVFWYNYKRNEWYWWSVVSTVAIMLLVYFNVQVDAFINNWQGRFFNTMQLALTEPGSVTPEEFYGQIAEAFVVLMPRIIVAVIVAFYTAHYVFRWRKAMNSYYMAWWPSIRTTEGAAQRVQEDTMRFASITEDLGSAFLDSLITLVVFIPLLWTLSQNVTSLPFIGDVPGSLVWVALLSAAFGTVLLALVGIKLPGLNFENQKVEAAYRKELVYGEDHEEYAQPATWRELFANVQKNYFRLYWHYTYFNLARYGYLNLAGYIPLLALSPSILAGALTLGLYQQVQQAFGQVASSFQFLARAWSTVIELLSVHKRLMHFESHIPRDQEPIKESVSQYAD